MILKRGGSWPRGLHVESPEVSHVCPLEPLGRCKLPGRRVGHRAAGL